MRCTLATLVTTTTTTTTMEKPDLTRKLTPGDWKAVPAFANTFAVISGGRYGHGDPEALATIGGEPQAPADPEELAAIAAVMARAKDLLTALQGVVKMDPADPASIEQARTLARLALKATEETFHALLDGNAAAGV